MNAGAIKNLQERIDQLEVDNSESVEYRNLVELRDLVVKIGRCKFYPPEDAESWKTALWVAETGRAKEEGEFGGSLEGEKAIGFSQFKYDIEAMKDKRVEKVGSKEFGFRYALLEPTDRALEAYPTNPTQEDYVIGELIFRYNNNDYEFFGELTRLMEIRGNARVEDRILSRKYATPFIAFDLGVELGIPPTRDEILEKIREAGYVVQRQNEAEVFSECGLDFLPERKRGPKKKTSI